MLGFVFLANPKVVHATPASSKTWVPNESIVASAMFKNNAQVQMTRKANPQTGEGFYTLYLTSTNAKGQSTCKAQSTTFHFSTLHNQKPLRFEVADANRDGKEELFLQLQDDAGTTYAALFSWSGTKLSLLHQANCTNLTYEAGTLQYTGYDFDYGMETHQIYRLSAKGSLSQDKSQCYEMGIRLGLSYEDFKALLGSSAKKQYLKTGIDEKTATTRHFLIKSSYGEFVFEGPKLESGSTPYTLVEMTYKTKGLRTIGGLAPGDRFESLKVWLDNAKREDQSLLSSSFLTKELLVKTNINTIGNQTEVWHFKHQNGNVTEIHCELE